MKKILILLLTAFLSAGSLSAQSADIKKLIQQANQGDAIAQYTLGVMYATGQGVPQDSAQAVKWLRLAADQGDAWAQYNLGYMYDIGQGVPQDYTQALKWLRLAADQGNALAQHNLGLMYAKGLGVPQDYAQALKWTRLAADQGFEESKNSLGLLTAPPHKMFFPRLFKPLPLGVIPWLLALWLLPLPLLFFKKTREMPMEWLLAAARYYKYVNVLFALSITYALVGWTGLLVSLLTLPFISGIFAPVGVALILCIYKQQWVPVTHLVAGGSFSLLSFWLAMLLFWLTTKIDMWNTDSTTKA